MMERLQTEGSSWSHVFDLRQGLLAGDMAVENPSHLEYLRSLCEKAGIDITFDNTTATMFDATDRYVGPIIQM